MKQWWFWPAVAVGGYFVYKAFFAKNVTPTGQLTSSTTNQADLISMVKANTGNTVSNLKLAIGTGGTVVVKGNYGGNSEYTVINAANMTDAFAQARQLTPQMNSYAHFLS